MSGSSLAHWIGLLAALAAGGVACGIPTQAPLLEQRWVIAAPVSSITLADVLPASVTVQGGEFLVQGVSSGMVMSLTSLCQACALLGGTTAPIPQFKGSSQVLVSFPSSVIGMTLAAGNNIEITLTNGLGFDPLADNGAGARGSLSLTVVDGSGAVLATLEPQDALPNQQATIYQVALPAGQTVYGPLGITAEVSVPTLGFTPIPASPHLAVDASMAVLRATAAIVVVADHAIDVTTGSFGVDILSGSERSYVRAGTLHLEVVDPLGIMGAATVHFERGGQDAIPPREITLTGAASEELSIDFDEATVQSLLSGGDLQLRLTANVSGTGDKQSVVVHPTDQIDVTPRLAFTTQIGG